MVKRSELEAKIKEKILLSGNSGVGKTYTATMIAKLVAETGRKVIFIDPEFGAERELEKLSDEVLANITLKMTPRWEMLRSAIESNDDCFLKILDGLSEVFDSCKYYLEQRSLASGNYSVGNAYIDIADKETFVLPFVMYPKVYTEVLATCRKLVEQSSHIIVTTHPFGESDARKRLTEGVYRKFDTVLSLKLQTVTIPIPKAVYIAQCKKHRGRPITGFAEVKGHIGQLETIFNKRMGIEVKGVEEDVKTKD